MSKKFCTTVYLEPDQHEKLIAISAASHVPKALMIRAALDEWLAKIRDPRFPFEAAPPRELLSARGPHGPSITTPSTDDQEI